ncbi:MAG: hypothetical protein ACLU9S_14475 [Oscillospiraceae bacterium]
MWMGEQITEFGIGNGISMILFAGIISRIPTARQQPGYQPVHRRDQGGTPRSCLVGIGCSWSLLIVFITNSERRIPVQYAKRVVGPEDVWRPEHAPAHQGQHVRRSAYHLRPVHRFSARDHHCVHRHAAASASGRV